MQMQHLFSRHLRCKHVNLFLVAALKGLIFAGTGEAHFCAPTFTYVVRTKKRVPSLSYLYVVCDKKGSLLLGSDLERCRTKILKGLCGVIGWFQVAADIGLLLK